jgi:hypothetical protein
LQKTARIKAGSYALEAAVLIDVHLSPTRRRRSFFESPQNVGMGFGIGQELAIFAVERF